MPKAKFSKGGDWAADLTGVFRVKLIKCADSTRVDDCWDWTFEITEPGDPNEGKFVGGLTSTTVSPKSKAYNYLRGLGMPELDPDQDLEAAIDTDDYIGCEGDASLKTTEKNGRTFCNIDFFNMPRGASRKGSVKPQASRNPAPQEEEADQQPQAPAPPRTGRAASRPAANRQAPPRVNTPADEEWDNVD